MEEIERALAAFGLQEKEIRVYLAALELGTQTAQKISEKAMLNRSTTYDILKKFYEDGISAKTQKNNITQFSVVGGEQLIKKLDEKRKLLEDAKPLLEEIQKSQTEKPTVQVFEGKEGVKTIFTDILNNAKHTDVIPTPKIFEVLEFIMPNYIRERAQRGITTRVIQSDPAIAKSIESQNKEQSRLMKVKPLALNSDTFLYNNTVAIIKLVKNNILCVVIRDKTIFEDYTKIFEKLWED